MCDQNNEQQIRVFLIVQLVVMQIVLSIKCSETKYINIFLKSPKKYLFCTFPAINQFVWFRNLWNDKSLHRQNHRAYLAPLGCACSCSSNRHNIRKHTFYMLESTFQNFVDPEIYMYTTLPIRSCMFRSSSQKFVEPSYVCQRVYIPKSEHTWTNMGWRARCSLMLLNDASRRAVSYCRFRDDVVAEHVCSSSVLFRLGWCVRASINVFWLWLIQDGAFKYSNSKRIDRDGVA